MKSLLIKQGLCSMHLNGNPPCGKYKYNLPANQLWSKVLWEIEVNQDSPLLDLNTKALNYAIDSVGGHPKGCHQHL